MATLTDLANRMKALPAILASEGSRCAVEVALAVHHDLTRVTPVDTSTALSNWDISLGSLKGSFHEPYAMGKKGSTRMQSIRGANAKALDDTEDKIQGQVMFITNSVDYIRKLNLGSSRQEPAGFVERAVLVGRIAVKKFKMKLR